LDRDLAVLYGVPTKALKQAVKRNAGRFPEDFMFILTPQEFAEWRSQFVTSKADRMGLRHAPMAFSEQGIAMLSSVLNSERAIRVNIAIMRAFVQLRGLLASHEDLARKLAALEKEYDAQFKVVFDAIRALIAGTAAAAPHRLPCRGGEAALSPAQAPTARTIALRRRTGPWQNRGGRPCEGQPPRAIGHCTPAWHLI
jgi:hypothetical protein